ncbi:hypothetical protein ATANTOWER_020549 [Ataeniobius toweri]|uniref:Uncharacterized protein n=1 Tax=Ataeniobius toweri TaxID=208326 RepID=A0ABU7B9G1_9TELE|nr:hypothetical protein [Ataeniobius toweri]
MLNSIALFLGQIDFPSPGGAFRVVVLRTTQMGWHMAAMLVDCTLDFEHITTSFTNNAPPLHHTTFSILHSRSIHVETRTMTQTHLQVMEGLSDQESDGVLHDQT